MNETTVRVLRSEAELFDLEEQWNELSDAAVYPNLFTTWDWQSIWWKHFGRELGGEPMILALFRTPDASDGVGAEPSLIGLLPFYRVCRRLPLFFGRKHLNLIGYGGTTCPEYLGPIVRRGFLDEAVDAFVAYLRAHPEEWDSLFLEDYATDDPATALLAEKLQGIFAARSDEAEPRYLIRFPDGYDAFLKTLSSHNRQRKRVRVKRAQERHGARIEWPAAGQLDQWFPLLPDLTRLARTRHGEKTPFDLKPYADFHRELLGRLLPKRRALVALLRYDDEAVDAAIWYCFLLKEKCYAYQQGFSPECEGSPSDVCLQLLLRHLGEHGITEFDFLRGMEWYKTGYNNASRETRRLTVFRRRGIAFWSRRLLENVGRPVYRRFKRVVIGLLNRRNAPEAH